MAKKGKARKVKRPQTPPPVTPSPPQITIQASPQQDSIWEKLSRLTESNLFWGGGVGMILVAYGFLIAGAVKFSVALIVIGWFIITISIYRHRFFESQSKRVQVIGQTFISGGLAVIFIILWLSLQPLTPEAVKQSPAPIITPSPATTPSPLSSESQIARDQLRADALKPIRDVAVRIKLNRTYSIEELGHFRGLFTISGNDDIPEFFLGFQDAYLPNQYVDPKAKQFGIRYTVRYRESKNSNTYVAIPAYTKPPKYTTILSMSHSVDTLEFSLDLYNQIPCCKTMEDLNRKLLHVYITQNLTDKISEFSFVVNNYELIAERADVLVFTKDKPAIIWFMPLSAAERAIQWNEMYLKATEEVAKRVPGAVVVWTLDFAIINPKKIPEPESKVNPYDQ